MLVKTFLSLLILALSCFLSAADVEVPFFKKTDCGDLCARIRCFPAQRAECDDKTQVFVPRDGDCYCCDDCVARTIPTWSVIDKTCKEDHCMHSDCHDIPAQECYDQGMAFAPKDNACACCDACEQI